MKKKWIKGLLILGMCCIGALFAGCSTTNSSEDSNESSGSISDSYEECSQDESSKDTESSESINDDISSETIDKSDSSSESIDSTPEEEIENSLFTFKLLKNDTYAVIGYTGEETELFFPATYRKKSVTVIEREAFKDRGDLKRIILPNSITSIEDYAFYNCSSLTELVIPDSVTHVGTRAFFKCDGLIKVTCPAFAISYIDKSALQTVVFTSGDNISKLKGCISLTTVVLPDSVITIEQNAFEDCSGLEEITIPNNTTSIGSSAFEGCTNLKQIIIPNSTTSIGFRAFYNCRNLMEITIPDSVTFIGNEAFSGCKNLQYNKNNGLKYLGNSNNPYVYLVEVENTSITTAIIESNCKVVGATFPYCTKLKEVVIPDSVVFVTDNMFSGCSGLTDITIGESVTSIGNRMFYRCINLKSVTLGGAVRYIGESAFEGCVSLSEILLPNSVISIGDFAFVDCALEEMIIPNSVISIGALVFASCQNLKKIEISESVTKMGLWALGGCSLTEIYVNENNSTYKSIDGNLYTKDGKTLIQYAIGKTDTTFIVPDTVTSIGVKVEEYIAIPMFRWDYIGATFTGCSSLTAIVIPDSVTFIGDYVFSGCSGLTEVVIPSSVITMGMYVFAYNSSQLVLYCETEQEPEDWDFYWNYNRGKEYSVVWGYKGE